MWGGRTVLAGRSRPPEIPEALRTQERTIFTPHLGSATTTARRSIERRAAENLLQILADSSNASDGDRQPLRLVAPDDS